MIKKSTDWIPSKETELAKLCKEWAAALGNQTNVTAYNWDQADCAETLTLINAFLAAYAAYQEDDSSKKLFVKDNTKKSAIKTMREFASSYVRHNRKMDDTAKFTMGIEPKDNIPTSHEPPKSQPITLVEYTKNRYEHKVVALNSENKPQKPGDAYGVRYAWQLGGTKPPSGEDLSKSKFTRKTAHVITYKESDDGKIAYYATCYENGKGERGAWSTVMEYEVR